MIPRIVKLISKQKRRRSERTPPSYFLTLFEKKERAQFRESGRVFCYAK